MPGRKPKPTNLKLLHGNPGKRKLPEGEPTPAKSDLAVPESLSDSAKTQFSVVAHQLDAAGILTELDTHALCLYCEAYARWMEANKLIQEDGLITRNSLGFPVQNPVIGIANKAFEQMLRILSEFGMTPSSRARVKVTDEKALDPLEELLNRRQ